MANPKAMDTIEQREAEGAAPIPDPLHILYYAARLQGEQLPDGQDRVHFMESEEQAAVIGGQSAKRKSQVKVSKEKMKPGFCQECGVTEATAWRCVVTRQPALGQRCNRCAMELRNNAPLSNKAIVDMHNKSMKHLEQLAQQVQAKTQYNVGVHHKRSAVEIEAIDNTQLHGEIKRRRASPEGQDSPASDHSSEGTTLAVQCQTLMMMDTDIGASLLATKSSQESPSFTIPAYRGEHDKQPRLKREASKRADHLLAVMKDDQDSNVSSKRSPIKGKKIGKHNGFKKSSGSRAGLQLQHTLPSMQEGVQKSGREQNIAGALTACEQLAAPSSPPAAPPHPHPLPSPSLSSPAPTTVQQHAAVGSQIMVPTQMPAGASQHAIMPSNSFPTAGNQQLFQQLVVSPYYSIMPYGMMNASTGAGHAYAIAGMAAGQGVQAVPMMMHPGTTMAWGQRLPTPAMYVQPGMGMAFQGYAMQQLQRAQLNTAMSWVGNAQS